MIKRAICLFLAWFCLFLTAVGCGKAEKSAEAVLGEILAVSSLGGGVIYRSGVAEGEVGYMPPFLAEVFWGKESAERDLPLVSSYAVYSSGRMEICEVAVFHVYSRGDTGCIAEMCHTRAHSMETYLSTADESVAVRVFVRGNYVIMAACEGAESLIRHASRLVS